MHNNWIQLGKQAVWDLIGAQNQGSVAEWILLSLAVIALVLVFSRISQMSDIPACGPGRSLAVVCLGVITLAGMWVLIDGILLPGMDLQIPRPVVRGIVVALALVVTVPVMCLMLRAHVRNVVMAWGGALVVAILLLWLGRLSLDAISAGSEEAQRTKARSEEMQEFLNEH